MFEEIISVIKPLDQEAMSKCQLRLDNLTKPLGSLHSFEHIALQIAGITGQYRPSQLEKSIIIMAGDHGVFTKNITKEDPQATTEQLVLHACQQSSIVQVFAQHVSAPLMIVDIGVADDVSAIASIHAHKIACGTNDITKGPAMTKQQSIDAIHIGVALAQEQTRKGTRIVGLGAIGVGSEISNTAMIACYSSKTIGQLVGTTHEGSEDLFTKKIKVLEKALAVNQPEPTDVIDVLSTLGSFELAGLVGVILGSAAGGAAVVLDGLTTSVAALLAVKIAPQLKDYMIVSHLTGTPAYEESLALLGICGYLHLDMQTGDGTGAVLGISIIDASLHVINDMKTFGEAEVPVAQDGPGALRQNKDVKE